MSIKWVVTLVLASLLAGLSITSIDAQRVPPGQLKKTPTLTVTPSPSATPSPTPTSTLRPTATPSPSPTLTPTPTPTDTDTPEATETETPTASATPPADTDTPTATENATATATASPSPTSTPTETQTATPESYPDWKGQYFDNTTLSGTPVLTRNDAAINFEWGTGSPDPRLPVDAFSVRWSRNLEIASSGTYLFSAWSDDGERLYVDGVLVLDAWYDRACTENQVSLPLVTGPHALAYEYYENRGNACARLNWTPVVPTLTPTDTPPAGPGPSSTPNPTYAALGLYAIPNTLYGCRDERDDPAPCPGS